MFCVFKFYIIPYSYYNFIVSDKVTKKDLPTAKKIKKKTPGTSPDFPKKL